jgi:hypothetical protein
MLDQPDHVIAQIAEQPRAAAGRSSGSSIRAFGNQGAQVVQRIAGLVLESCLDQSARDGSGGLSAPWHCQTRSGFIPMIE